jgi:GNAT superfamily N-acetyltransferase
VELRSDGWLTGLMERNVFRLELSPEEEDVCGPLGRHSAGQTSAFYYCKVDTRHIGLVRQLTRVGMYVADTNVTLELSRSSSLGSAAGVTVESQRPGEEEAVLAIAATAYRYSRFHLDPLVGLALAHLIKREWCRSYLLGQRGDRLLVARLGDRPVGFLAALVAGTGEARSAIIDLLGVDTAHQRRRVGAALTMAFIAAYSGKVGSLQVGTQAANIESLRLYERLGFSIVRTQYVMHLHVQDGAPRS